MLTDGFPVVKLDAGKLDSDGRMPAFRLLVELELAKSSSEARRVIEQGGMTVADGWSAYRKMLVRSYDEPIMLSDRMIVRIGRSKVAMIQMEQTMDGIFEAGQVWRSGDATYEIIIATASMEDTEEPVVVFNSNDGMMVQTLTKWRERIERHGFKLDASNEKGLCQ